MNHNNCIRQEWKNSHFKDSKSFCDEGKLLNGYEYYLIYIHKNDPVAVVRYPPENLFKEMRRLWGKSTYWMKITGHEYIRVFPWVRLYNVLPIVTSNEGSICECEECIKSKNEYYEYNKGLSVQEYVQHFTPHYRLNSLIYINKK